MNKTLKIILIVIAVAIIIPAIFIISVYAGAFGSLQDKEELLSYKNAAASVVLSDNGELIGKIFSENRTNISFGQIPLHLRNALIATEDARFFEHEGIDSKSLFRVLIKTILLNKEGSGGGSTITQQLAKNMFGRKNGGSASVIINKTKEAILARRLEKIFTKEDILTLYLNTVSFGENVFGIEAASRRYFNRKVEELRIEESAVLVGILKANDYYNPRLHPENAKNRRNVVISQMKRYNYITSSTADSLGNLPLVLNYSNVESKGPADYFIYQVKNEASRIVQQIDSATGKKWNLEEDGLIITTTLDLTLQNYVNSSFYDHLAVMQKRLSDQYESDSGKIFLSKLAGSELGRLNLAEKANEVGIRQIFDWKGYYSDSISVADSLKHELKLLHGGLLAIDPVTGAVKAWAGGIDFQTHPYDQILAQRQLASTFKPILYAAALEKGIDPCFYLNNDSIVVVSDDEWKPRNFDNSYGGKYSLAGALVHSMNIPTFNLFRIVGYGRLDSLWKEMGFTFHMVNTPSLAVGTAEANIVEVASAYSLFANGGYKITPEIIVSLKDPAGNIVWQNEFKKSGKRVISERTSILISAILQRAVREGTGAALRSVYGVTLPLAGKTGTSQDYADAWFAAFNPSLVMVSRVGATFPSVHFNSAANGSGSTLALPLVAMTLKKAQNDRELRAKLITQFHELPPEMAAELNCPDYREKRLFENILDIFRKDRIEYGKESDMTDQKKRSIFKKLFNPKNRR